MSSTLLPEIVPSAAAAAVVESESLESRKRSSAIDDDDGDDAPAKKSRVASSKSMPPPPPPPPPASKSAKAAELRRTDSTTILPQATAKRPTPSSATVDEEDDSESTGSFVEDRAHRVPEDAEDDTDDTASETTTTTSLSESTTHHTITNRDINLAADADDVPELSEDKLYEIFLNGDILMKFLSVVRGRSSKSGGGDSETAFQLKMIKGQLTIQAHIHLPPAAYICNCRIRMRIASDATFEPFSLAANKVVAIFSNTKPTNVIIMTVYRHAPSTIVIRERDPEEGMHGEIAVELPMLLPSEQLLCEMPVIPNTHSIPFSPDDLTRITTTAQRMGAFVRFCIYEIKNKAILLVKLVNPKDESTVITYKYMMSIKHTQKNTLALVVDTSHTESEEEILKLIKRTRPVVDDSFDAGALRTLTNLPSMGTSICLFVGGETDQEVKNPLCMCTKYGPDTSFGVIIMSNSSESCPEDE